MDQVDRKRLALKVRAKKLRASIRRIHALLRATAAGLLLISMLMSLTLFMATVYQAMSLFEVRSAAGLELGMQKNISYGKDANDLLDQIELVKIQIDSTLQILKSIRSNAYKLEPHEMIHQFKTAKVSGLKERVKRFACWHSCFGQFRRKAFRQPYSLKSNKPVNPPEDGDLSPQKKREITKENIMLDVKTNENILKAESALSESENKEKGGAPYDTNQLTEGNKSNGSEKPRRKKSPTSAEIHREKSSRIEVNRETKQRPSPSPKPVSNMETVLKLENTKVEVKKVDTGDVAKPASVPSKEGDAQSGSESEEGASDDETSESSEGDDETSESEETSGDSEDDAGDGIDKEDLEEEQRTR